MTLHDLPPDAIESAARGVPGIKNKTHLESITLQKFIGNSVEVDLNGNRYRADLLKGEEGGSYEYKLTPTA
ncbi:MAG: hypothetical protein GXY44_11655 [Phycisphaerales bacterium]|nr:hypothetical protein [Phycisphaerales bacterium]